MPVDAPALTTEPWDRLPGEPSIWYSRFNHYRLLGPKRTIVKTWAELGSGRGKKGGTQPQGNWDDAVKRFRWHERAAAWDMALAREDAAADAADRKEARQQRRRLAKLAFNKLTIALNALTEERLATMSPFAAFLSVRTILRELRLEFDEPETRTDVRLTGARGGPVQITLELTPPVDSIAGNGHVDFDPDDLQSDQLPAVFDDDAPDDLTDPDAESY